MIIKNFSYIDDLKKNYSSILNSISSRASSEMILMFLALKSLIKRKGFLCAPKVLMSLDVIYQFF